MELMCALMIVVAIITMAPLMSMFIAITSRAHTVMAPAAIHLDVHLRELPTIHTPRCVTEAAVHLTPHAKLVSQVAVAQQMVIRPPLVQQCQRSIASVSVPGFLRIPGGVYATVPPLLHAAISLGQAL